MVVLAVVLLSVTGILGSVGVTIGVGILRQFIKFQKLEVSGIVWLVSAVWADVIITTPLAMHLVSAAALICQDRHYRGK